MNNATPKIIRLLTDTAKYPTMYAHDVEVMLMRISTLLEASGVSFSTVEFYCKHGGRDGCSYLLEKPAGMSFDDWTRQVVADAISMIEADLTGAKNDPPKAV